MESKTIGIIGGMGPLATADLFKKIISHTKADSDKDHIRIVIDNNTSIPDRTEYLMGRGESPKDKLIETAVRLESMGAEILVMPCNTAHYFYDDIRKKVKCSFISMIEETALAVKREEQISGAAKTTALLSTEGTAVSGIYDSVFAAHNLKLLKPEKEEQEIITRIIYNVKKGIFKGNESAFRDLLKSVKSRGAESFILGCTELPLYFEVFKFDEKIFDPTEILAVKAVEKAGKEIV